MKKFTSVGIVAEYNPFHKGHLYQLKETLDWIRLTEDKSVEETDSSEIVAVAVMSGNFTQRGEVAMLDKWTRAEMAVANGIDLVVELPVVFACNSAGYFARAGVEILENLGVNYISFGSESGNLSELMEIVEFLKHSESEVEGEIRKKVKEGLSYPRARQKVLEKYLGPEKVEILGNPNNILAFEYLKNMKKACPITIKRTGAGYNEMGAIGEFASASYIRKCIGESAEVNQWVPDASMQIIEKSTNMGSMDKLYPLIVQKILTSSAEELEMAFAGGEGLGNKLKKSIRACKSYEQLVEMLKSKRYTRTRISRLLAHVLLEMKAENVENAMSYVRVLAFSERGAKYLKAVKKSGECNLPIITNINKDIFPEVEETMAKDILAADLYNLAMGRDLYRHSEFIESVRRL